MTLYIKGVIWKRIGGKYHTRLKEVISPIDTGENMSYLSKFVTTIKTSGYSHENNQEKRERCFP